MITNLNLVNFRNYSSVNFSTSEKYNLLIGSNGQGKTNLLEAIYFLSLLRSFRTSQVKELRKIGTSGFRVAGTIKNTNSWEQKLEVIYQDTRKLKVDDTYIAKASEFIGYFRTVAFAPNDILIIQGNSSFRRKFIDMALTRISHSYLQKLQDYNVALKSRNKILKNGYFKGVEKIISPYEEIIAINGLQVINERIEFISRLKAEVLLLLRDFYGENFEFDLKYKTTVKVNTTDEYFKKLYESRDKDFLRKQTSFGPQTNDIDIILSKKNLRYYGSSGQCRLMALCLKMATINLFSSQSIDTPLVVLVDDVTGELDQEKKSAFFKVINKAEQVFFTATDIPHGDFFNTANIYKVDNAKLNKL